MLTQCEFDLKKFEFGDRTNTFLPLPKDNKALDIQQVAILDKDSCLVLGKEALQKLKSANTQPKGHKRQHSTWNMCIFESNARINLVFGGEREEKL